ncbi:hypothetical protein [Pleomorphomonas sp. JP5]|uniref:hypothetical protein n=1 Tax=Pleomorphomonas sp. JP5 TaxID=2942998 RepID=UPI0020447111|nr:hypothetical protein [Pleomorphomonas sp. JP5]MCM5558508.1 hypothetical protein [Pleomorphomonas sp. JP5]
MKAMPFALSDMVAMVRPSFGAAGFGPIRRFSAVYYSSSHGAMRCASACESRLMASANLVLDCQNKGFEAADVLANLSVCMLGFLLEFGVGFGANGVHFLSPDKAGFASPDIFDARDLETGQALRQGTVNKVDRLLDRYKIVGRVPGDLPKQNSRVRRGATHYKVSFRVLVKSSELSVQESEISEENSDTFVLSNDMVCIRGVCGFEEAEDGHIITRGRKSLAASETPSAAAAARIAGMCQ